MDHLNLLKVISGNKFTDSRGWFTESYNKRQLAEQGIGVEFVQDNHSYSACKGTLRGIHFQKEPKAQSKLVRCTRGAILDVVVDLRKGSATYKQWWSYKLSAENCKQLFIPKGFGHAFVTLEDDTEIQYKVDEYYSKEHDRSIRYDDPELAIDWQVKAPILSEKDLAAPPLADSDADFSITVLVTGAQGQLGHDVLGQLEERGIRGVGADIGDFDITDGGSTEAYINSLKPDVVVHCAAYTAVDMAEDERELCRKVNVIGTANIAESCKRIGAAMVYISTDYVFDGSGDRPWAEDETVSPLGIYGETKAEGELAVRKTLDKHIIVRTSWVFGKNGSNFVKTMLRLGRERDKVRVVDDQVGAPTYTVDLARLVCDMLQTNRYGTYHATGEGWCSWASFAEKIFALTGVQATVVPVPSSEYQTKARRPLNSRLGKDRLDKNGFERLPHWQDALERFLKELGEEVRA
ncbi:MAG: dTDP-4-dehydrorhamnose 3,5-epimerase [Firmicutes bacterium HGW-Firmicutes-15]|jgi:dTDP-4-dehydrorhamnose reductase/dTDP-4-dehydrorhamnose 3,5-epimerase|nr:MAG: dTDP-4-dehydrorhamnose 3,5-epimerase [Spirochaetae bacterium HGW-Spirochaetae-2]PKM75900.1 MAG: dTDP-4-dehydrorhamnose 3,5-epimerase [Firmicutes bacterium HGW-Firmicutes-15]